MKTNTFINKASIFDHLTTGTKTIDNVNDGMVNAIIACKKLATRKPLPPNVSAQIRLFTHVGETRLITASGTQAIRVPMGKHGFGTKIKTTNNPNVFEVTATKKKGLAMAY
jgi:hypothetical protein